MPEHRGVTALTGTDQHHQRAALPVGQVMDLGAQTPTRAADRMVSGLDPQFGVTRQIPLCPTLGDGSGSWRADGHD